MQESKLSVRKPNSRSAVTFALVVPTIGFLALSGCTCNDAAPPAAPPAVEAAPPAAEPPPEAKPDRKDAKADRKDTREQRRADRREQRKVDFSAQAPVFQFPVLAATSDAEKVRAQIMTAVQPVAGVALRWTLRSCASETLWDSADGTLNKQGASIAIQNSLETDTCASSERSRSSLLVAHRTTDEAAAKATHRQLLGLTATDSQLKVSVESVTSAPEGAPTLVVRSVVRSRGAASAVDTSTGLGQAMKARFWGPEATVTLAPVCSQGLTIREWVLEEEQAMPSKGNEATKAGKNGKARKQRERRRSWARLTVSSDPAGAGKPHAMLYMRAAPKREAADARVQLPTTTFNALKSAGMTVEMPLVDARYRCGG
ncbi:MAG: hypothetical protein CL927_14520 [Deltaproteobacteria bacterium]|nr:hypothetical protein [Deltaproteobacteria bacterium]HCH63828.1 hypothetical protein [Deltaproteobacteria bacterium]